MFANKILKRVIDIWYYKFASPLAYAKHIGVDIGEKCLIGTKRFSTEPYLIKIGNHVQITKGVVIHTHGGANPVRKKYPNFDIFGKVIIEDWAYIGSDSIILPGVTIGQGTIVGAGSVVTKSTEPFTVVAGNPAKRICSLQDYIDKNFKYNAGTKTMTPSEKKKILEELPDELFIKK